jgi:NAD(P)-dependent dehydrogenase (short-subunit alcohol dehydrogenase family)
MSGSNVVLVTGASSGFGHATALLLQERGYRVYGASRRPPEDAPFTTLSMDVCDDESVQRGVERVLAEAGRIDVLVNCAGMGIAGSVEDVTITEAHEQLETNFFGALRLCRAVLPAMRAQGAGTIVNISSIAGRVGIPYQAHYSASKFALEGMTEALRMEVAPFGIRTVLVEAGDFHTGFTAHRRVSAVAQASAYGERFQKSLKVMIADEEHGESPERMARLVARIIVGRSRRFRYVVGPWHEVLVVNMRGLLPDGLLHWALRLYYHLG